FPKLPLRRVRPDEIRRTILSKKAVGSMITLGRQGLLKDIELCYLALATTYGLRRVEMTRLKPSSFPDEHHLIVDTAKGGSRTTHLIPPQITPYLGSFKHYEADSLTHMFHRIARKCGLNTGAGYGWQGDRQRRFSVVGNDMIFLPPLREANKKAAGQKWLGCYFGITFSIFSIVLLEVGDGQNYRPPTRPG
ncbi:unnamed protein product, partial [marine sediment metagenome]